MTVVVVKVVEIVRGFDGVGSVIVVGDGTGGIVMVVVVVLLQTAVIVVGMVTIV